MNRDPGFSSGIGRVFAGNLGESAFFRHEGDYIHGKVGDTNFVVWLPTPQKNSGPYLVLNVWRSPEEMYTVYFRGGLGGAHDLVAKVAGYIKTGEIWDVINGKIKDGDVDRVLLNGTVIK